MIHPIHNDRHPPQCPRCGYDQRGVMTTWSDACPLHGTCSECGLTLDWAEVLCPDKFQPRWCIEFAPPSQVPLAAVKTLWRSTMPWNFWQSMRMAYTVRTRRLVHYMGVFVLLAILIYVAGQSLTAYTTWRAFHAEVAAAIARSSPVNVLTAERDDLAAERDAVQRNLESLIEAQSDPRLRIDAKERLAEARVYTEAAIEHMEADLIALDVQIQKAAQLPPPPMPTPVPLTRELIRVILTPYSTRPGPTLVSGTQGFTYPSPLQQHHDLNPMSLWIEAFREGGWIALACLFLLPAAFVLLPWSRKRANVRWVHLGRVTAYSMLIPMLAFVVLWAGNLGATSGGDRAMTMTVVFILTCMAIIVWWACAIHYYLHMPNVVAVAVMLCVFSLVLCVTSAMWITYPMSLHEFFQYTGFIE